jgi:hypothetical protein
MLPDARIPADASGGCWIRPELLVWVGPPAGIEPAAPSLPFVLPRTSRRAAARQRTVRVRG